VARFRDAVLTGSKPLNLATCLDPDGRCSDLHNFNLDWMRLSADSARGGKLVGCFNCENIVHDLSELFD
jgi:hypothetical protein